MQCYSHTFVRNISTQALCTDIAQTVLPPKFARPLYGDAEIFISVCIKAADLQMLKKTVNTGQVMFSGEF